MLRKGLKTIAYLLFLNVTVLLLLEMCYRLYVIDFYQGQLIGLNDEADLGSSDEPTILVIGDSFSADQSSYVGHLRGSLPGYRVINAAIPGTTISQHRLLFRSRMKRFEPDILLYQIYVGNDLLEFHHPTSSDGISIVRKCYWWLTDRFLVLGYINARLPQLRQAIYHDLPIVLDPKEQEQFSVERYSQRSKMQFRAEPYLLENTVFLKRNRVIDMKNYTKQLETMLNGAPSDCTIKVLVMPHCSQVNESYASNMTQIGAKFSPEVDITQVQYPFIDYLNEHFDQHIQIINPLQNLQQAESKDAVYYANDPHLNPFGQGVVAKQIIKTINKN